MNTTEKRNALIEKCESILARKPFGKMDEAEFKSTMLLADSLNDGARRERIAGVLGAEERNAADEAAVNFRNYMRSPERRTYSGLVAGTGSAGGFFVPTEWKRQYQAQLVSSSGILKAGATIVEGPAIGAKPYLNFFSSDSGNVASVLAENAQLTKTNPVASVSTPHVVKLATGLNISNELVGDISFDLDSFLQSTFGVRCGRAFNTFASVDSTYGVIPKVTVSATATSSTLPTIAELTNMQTAIDYAYREDGAAYMLSPALEILLRQQVGTSGNKLYPEMENGRLLGHDYVVNVDQPYAPAAVAVLFGDYKKAFLVQEVSPVLIASKETFAEFFQTAYFYFHRVGIKIADTSAVTALALHS
jgi:HK97 family phage major capsid protein